MRRRKGAITEIYQVAGVVESSLHENEINNNQQASQYREKEHNKWPLVVWLGRRVGWAACTEQMSADDPQLISTTHRNRTISSARYARLIRRVLPTGYTYLLYFLAWV
jgi:hypothetical protein